MRNGNGIMFLAELGLQGAENEEKAYPVIRKWTEAVYSYASKLGVA